MKNQTRLLPRLDQVYTQKKSYEVHKKKLQSIKLSRSLSKKSLSFSKINNNQQDNKSIKSLIYQHSESLDPSISLTDKNPLQKHMQTIQQAKPGLSYWLKKMNPHQKRLKQQQIKQNKRIRQKIKNTLSFIVQKNQLSDHQKHYQGIKNRLSRFSVDKNSQKTKLRCEIVLEKINEIEKQKSKLQESRLMQYERLQSPKSSSKKIIPVIAEKERLSQILPRRSKILPEKITITNKQSSSRVKDHMIKRPNNTSFLREKVELQNKTNAMKTTSLIQKQIFDKNKSSQRYNRVKTQLIERASTNRLFNNSKLSNLSSLSQKPEMNINLNDYKMVRVNFNNKSRPYSLKRVPSLQQTSYENPMHSKNSLTMKNQTQLKKYVSTRIKTQNSSLTHLLSKNQGFNKFDYQKKRVQRFLKSKTSLSTKDLLNHMQTEVKIQQNDKKAIHEIKKPQESIPIIQQKQQSKLATIQRSTSSQLLERNLNENKSNLEESSSAYFATEVQ